VRELETLTVALDRVLVDESRTASDEGDALVPLDQPLVVGDSFLDDPANSRHYRGEVHLDPTDADAELLGSSCVVGDLGGPDQGLGGDASPGDSGATDRAALEQRHRFPASPRSVHAGPAAHPAADDRHVVSPGSSQPHEEV